jgi:hypothetical protein
MTPSLRFTAHTPAMLAITLLALLLRFWQLGALPPGWRDDELIESFVISQKVIDGDLAVFYPDASGHEALYHALKAGMLALFGPGALGIRGLSALLGTLAVPLTFLLGRRLFGPAVGFVAAAGLAFSFWSLMYSRIGLRHITLPALALVAFYFLWRALENGASTSPHAAAPPPRAGKARAPLRPAWLRDALLAGLFIGLGFYSYFAGRGVPLIVLAFAVYLALVARARLRRQWPRLAVTLGLAALLAVPLLVTLARQPESEARIAEVAVPLIEARQGNFEPLRRYVRITLSMFHSDGDEEWLYNIPHRPVFGPVGALFFWSGVALAAWEALRPFWPRVQFYLLRRRAIPLPPAHGRARAAAFLLLWWLAGISPGFISVPPASLGHTILALPAVYLLAALPVGYAWERRGQETGRSKGALGPVSDRARWIRRRLGQESSRSKGALGPVSDRARWIVPAALGLLLVGGVAARDLPAYFQEWPRRGMVRFLYHADVRDVALYLNAHPELTDFGVTSLLAGPWDKLALQIDLDPARAASAAPRWYNPQRALLLEPPLSFGDYPQVEMPFAPYTTPVAGPGPAGGYRLIRVVDAPLAWAEARPVCFTNGLCWLAAAYDPAAGRLTLAWRAERPLDLPPQPLISNPPPPGVYAGPRLAVFAQLQDADGRFLTGDDGLWVDPATLRAGDLFVQQHWLAPPQDLAGVTAVIGLYDPKSGARILTTDGRDFVRVEIGE